jgi:hypothetical protein
MCFTSSTEEQNTELHLRILLPTSEEDTTCRSSPHLITEVSIENRLFPSRESRESRKSRKSKRSRSKQSREQPPPSLKSMPKNPWIQKGKVTNRRFRSEWLESKGVSRVKPNTVLQQQIESLTFSCFGQAHLGLLLCERIAKQRGCGCE